MKKTPFYLIYFIFISLAACNSPSSVEVNDTSEMQIASQEEIDALMEEFILAENGATIQIPEGFYEMNNQLILDDVRDITVQGAGMEKTILSFKTLKTGGEGVKVAGDNITLQDFSVYDAPGDGIKTQHCDTIIFRRINATWTNGDKSKNGTYALYPVQCKNVLVDECTASHSRDAGIYVGQSENVLVKNSTAFGNVAGIEIENCDNAEVYNCKAYDNTGGILVFNLPGLVKADAAGTRIYDNEIIDNNHVNFALNDSSNSGNAVTQIPPGSGVIILAGKDVEVFNNKILRNKTVGVTVASYHITQFPIETSNGWNPYSYNISIHDNTYERSSKLPDVSKDLGKLVSMKNAHGAMKTQDIVYDGIWDDEKGDDISKNPMNVCFNEPDIENLHFTYFELSETLSDIKGYKDYTPFNCTYTVKTNVDNLKNL